MITVTGTENLLMAAVLADGVTVLENAAREPEVVDLANLLVKMGAKIDGIGTDRLVVQGVDKLHGAEYTVIPDRIETGTFLCAVAATGGDVTLTHTRCDILDAVVDKLRETGAVVTKDVPDYAVVHGNPATIKGWACACGDVFIQKGEKHLVCARCGTDRECGE